MKVIYIFNLIISVFIVAKRIYEHDLINALGWLCAIMWLCILLIEESKKDANKNN